MVTNNYKKYKQLTKEYKYFVYDGYSVIDNINSMRIVYKFNLADKYFFNPSIEFVKKKNLFASFATHELDVFAFNLGMIELISYWKAACPLQIIVKPFHLHKEQIEWWKKVYFHGLGEFFYMNSIPVNADEFVEIISESDKQMDLSEKPSDEAKVIVPVGGGKDSVVTLEILKKKVKTIPLIVNPRKASLDSIHIAGFSNEDFVEINRTIDPLLLNLNDQGFLNGHTPFSALLAFVSLMVAFMTGSKYIALSNESSANEPTHPETGVNHQYSKSFEFERDFRHYVFSNITRNISYFSFLRPLNELSIAQKFSTFPRYFEAFKSCNVGSKTDVWCGKCPKCLFTFIILSPYLEREELTRIFGKDLLDDPSLIDYFNELTGMSPVKPFECVGTIEEVNLALSKTIQKLKGPLPYLLDNYKKLSGQYQLSFKESSGMAIEPDNNHFLNAQFLGILKSSLNEQKID